MTYDKPFKTTKELLEILKNRGLIINDDKFATSFLESVSYYRLSVYFLPFYESQDKFKNGVKFSDVCRLYEFDSKLRSIVFRYIEQIEINLRAKIANIHAKHFGAFGYIDDGNSLDASRKSKKTSVLLRDELLENIQKEKARSNEVFIKHIKDKYGTDRLPIWAASEILSFGTLSKFYAILPKKLKQEVIKKLGLNNLDTEIFGNWLEVLSVVRNTCAHHARIWNRKFMPCFKYPKNKNKFNFLDTTVATDKMFFVLSVIILLLQNKILKNELKKEIFSLFQKYPQIDNKQMGFVTNYEKFDQWR